MAVKKELQNKEVESDLAVAEVKTKKVAKKGETEKISAIGKDTESQKNLDATQLTDSGRGSAFCALGSKG